MTDPVALPEDIARFIQSGISMTLASRSDRLVPSLAKSVGCRVSEARDQVTMLVFAQTAATLLQDVARCRQIAAVFSQPTTHRTLQIKGRDVRAAPASPADWALVRRYLALFTEELRPLGWDESFVQGVFWHEAGELVSLQFTPGGAFQQTPGPGAGAAMCLQANRGGA